ncbi:L-2-hydroxyglutarate oxidase LhgO [Clostridium sp. C105KSO15]|nr:L-2-hydroxyglutarate oxidase LhgO [Clostridium sp. C105KSO15]
MYDVIIIGAGVSGSAVARELSRYKVNACVLEKEEDVCCGTSKANSAIIHAGYDAAEGSLMAKLNVEGNQIMPELSKELDIPFEQCGSLVVCLDEASLPNLQALYDRGVINGVEDLEIITDKARIREMEPNLTDEVVAVLSAPTAGIVCPFHLNIALAENAYTNGIDFKFDTEVESIEPIEDGWKLETSQGVYETRYVVNAAGVHADRFHNMVSESKIHITPRRGDYFLLDKNAGKHVNRTIFALPSKYGKGVLVTPTVHGNLIIGPTAVDIEDKEGTATTREGLDELSKASLNVKNLPMRQVITSFAGLRAHEDHHEFIIRELEDAPGFVDCAGIESPGLTSSPAIGKMVAEILREKLDLDVNPDFNGTRKGNIDLDALSKEEKAALIEKEPAYGNIICRCEMVTEGELLDAIHRPLGARTLDGIKRRTRAGAGRCQAGFCTPKTMEILHRELGIPMTEITKSGGDSQLLVGYNKDRI